MQLEDWLDDLCVRFIINLPPEELASVERICFQVEEAQWFYEDFIRPLDPSLPSLSLKQFSLRIFQHCPLFSTWSAQHHTTAFAEFLAYKQRVPVRGAIMLSEAMDEVVLVKGWKKGANWSFPRGKINKDEDDLDCAIREVYEETGFDVRAAGLVKPEKEMKYIEVTMREQHMRLYVFKGVPRDTYFEPRTRKEISKIEWYKLTDLPTIKKKAHHENDEHPAVNANKFYMVAPFLHPLKKWITQQRKREGKQSTSSLALPPVLAEESATDNEGYQSELYPPHHAFSPPALSTLPEVLPVQQQPQFSSDPSAHLKELLKIGGNGLNTQASVQTYDVSGTEGAKSNALLALLRNGPGDDDTRSKSSMLKENIQDHSDINRMTGFPQPWQQPQSVGPTGQQSIPGQVGLELPKPQQNLLQLFSNASHRSVQQAIPSHPAPYQQTGDPQFTRDTPDPTQSSIVPPANALPKLTHHTRALLDAFQNKGPSEMGPSMAQPQPRKEIAPQQQSLLDAFTASRPAHGQATTQTIHDNKLEPHHTTALPSQNSSQSQLPRSDATVQAASLLDLFRKPTGAAASLSLQNPPYQQAVPAELAAGPVSSPKLPANPSQDEFLASLFRKERPGESVRQRSPVARAGQTGATISGPLNQPNLQNIARPPPTAEHDLSRSPVPANRVLYDPKQPTPVKILTRPEPKVPVQPRSPRAQKNHPNVTSPNKHAKPQEKPFQPQILRRPHPADSRQSQTPSPASLAPVGLTNASRRLSNLVNSSPSPNLERPTIPSPPLVGSPRRVSEQSDSHKQTLLQLFGGITPTAAPPMQKAPSRQSALSPGAVSPIMASQVVSPVTEDPISTRSRVGSLASIVSGGPGPALPTTQDVRLKPEKRQTTAEDKAFLLNYLGKFANQEG